MSQENVKVARAVFEAWNAGDMDAVRELYDPDLIVRMPEGWPEPGPFVGREAVMRQWEQQRETWDADDLQLISHSIDVGDRVAVRFIWRGAGHGPEANLDLAQVGGLQPTWSPDGTQVIWKQGHCLFRANADASSYGAMFCTGSNAVLLNPSWTGNQTEEYPLVVNIEPNPQILKLKTNGQSVRFPEFGSSDPTWSPSGDRIAFTSTRDGNSEIYIMNADGHPKPTSLTVPLKR